MMDAEQLYLTLHNRLDAMLQTAHLTPLEHRALKAAVEIAYESDIDELALIIKENPDED